MRKVIYGINLSLDGYCGHEKGDPNDEVHEHFAGLLRDVDLLAYGRKTYELMFPFWPDLAESQDGPSQAINDFAVAFAAVSQVLVFSRTLEKVEAGNVRILKAKPEEEIAKLKKEPGKNIMLGGVDIPEQLIKAGLVDEYQVVIHPVLAGKGRRLLEGVELGEQLRLKLAGSRTFKSGHVALHYLR